MLVTYLKVMYIEINGVKLTQLSAFSLVPAEAERI